ncbi:hypothetical protein Pelo_12604 [Pelomyxa schiedti]|nr:hypothetical protein Pelo_12604 [Pelomyxa schiedti]
MSRATPFPPPPSTNASENPLSRSVNYGNNGKSALATMQPQHCSTAGVLEISKSAHPLGLSNSSLINSGRNSATIMAPQPYSNLRALPPVLPNVVTTTINSPNRGPPMTMQFPHHQPQQPLPPPQALNQATPSPTQHYPPYFQPGYQPIRTNTMPPSAPMHSLPPPPVIPTVSGPYSQGQVYTRLPPSTTLYTQTPKPVQYPAFPQNYTVQPVTPQYPPQPQKSGATDIFNLPTPPDVIKPPYNVLPQPPFDWRTTKPLTLPPTYYTPSPSQTPPSNSHQAQTLVYNNQINYPTPIPIPTPAKTISPRSLAPPSPAIILPEVTRPFLAPQTIPKAPQAPDTAPQTITKAPQASESQPFNSMPLDVAKSPEPSHNKPKAIVAPSPSNPKDAPTSTPTVEVPQTSTVAAVMQVAKSVTKENDHLEVMNQLQADLRVIQREMQELEQGNRSNDQVQVNLEQILISTQDVLRNQEIKYKQLQQEEPELDRKVNSLTQEITRLLNQRMSWDGEMAELSRHCQQVEGDNKQKTEDNANLRTQLNATRNAVHANIPRYTETHTQHEELTARIAAAQAGTKESWDQAESHQQSIAQYADARAKLEELYLSMSTAIRTTSSDLMECLQESVASTMADYIQTLQRDQLLLQIKTKMEQRSSNH